MAHWRLGQVDDARQCLAKTIRWVDEANRQELNDLTGTRAVWEGWYEAIDVPMLLAEAKALIGLDRPTTLASP